MSDATNQVTWSEDGQPYSERFGDHFYSSEDGRAETSHVFIKGNQLPERWQGISEFKIGELGFGTGLNFLETWRQWRLMRTANQTLSFISVEAFPLTDPEMKTALNAWPDLAELADYLVKNWKACRTETVAMDEQTNLRVVADDVLPALDRFPANIDCWYLDGFSPAQNPEMWSAEVMTAIARHTFSNGTFASYTSAGWVRRNLEEAGFVVEKRLGFGRKRNMIAGRLEASA